MLKSSVLFLKKYKPHRQMTGKFLGLRMRNFQIIAFVWTRAWSKNFKSALVYL